MNYLNKLLLILTVGISGNCNASDQSYSGEFFFENKTPLTLKMCIEVIDENPKYVGGRLDSSRFITLKPEEEIFHGVSRKHRIKYFLINQMCSLPTETPLNQRDMTSRKPNKAYSFNLGKFISGEGEDLVEGTGIVIKEEEGQFPIKKVQHIAKISAEKFIQSKINKMQDEKSYTDMHIVTHH